MISLLSLLEVCHLDLHLMRDLQPQGTNHLAAIEYRERRIVFHVECFSSSSIFMYFSQIQTNMSSAHLKNVDYSIVMEYYSICWN